MGTKPEPNQPDSDREGFFAVVDRFVRRIEWGERIVRTAGGFVLAGMFFALPATELGASEPWYFWMGSGIIAFVAGSLLTWVLFRMWKDT